MVNLDGMNSMQVGKSFQNKQVNKTQQKSAAAKPAPYEFKNLIKAFFKETGYGSTTDRAINTMYEGLKEQGLEVKFSDMLTIRDNNDQLYFKNNNKTIKYTGLNANGTPIEKKIQADALLEIFSNPTKSNMKELISFVKDFQMQDVYNKKAVKKEGLKTDFSFPADKYINNLNIEYVDPNK